MTDPMQHADELKQLWECVIPDSTVEVEQVRLWIELYGVEVTRYGIKCAARKFFKEWREHDNRMTQTNLVKYAQSCMRNKSTCNLNAA